MFGASETPSPPFQVIFKPSKRLEKMFSPTPTIQTRLFVQHLEARGHIPGGWRRDGAYLAFSAPAQTSAMAEHGALEGHQSATCASVFGALRASTQTLACR